MYIEAQHCYIVGLFSVYCWYISYPLPGIPIGKVTRILSRAVQCYSVTVLCLYNVECYTITILQCYRSEPILYPFYDRTRDTRSNITLCLKEFRREILKAKRLYLTIYPELSPYTDII